LKKETEAFDSLRGTDDMVSFGAALQAAEDEYRPGEKATS